MKVDRIGQQFARIAKIIGEEPGEGDFGQCLQLFFEHLRANLVLPSEVTGVEDFQWEEYYVLGPGSPEEYAGLRATRPSYRDTYDLLGIRIGPRSQWMLFHDDIQAHVRRKSDEKEFVLGLAELRTVTKRSPNHQLLDDFAAFLVNYR